MPVSSVNLILGPAKSGKTTRAVERYCGFLDLWQQDMTQPEGVWIGPTFSAISAVRDHLAARSQGAWLNPRVATFSMLAEEIVAKGRRRVRSINHQQKLRILQQIVNRLLEQNRIRHFTAVARTAGFLRQVSAAIADLKRRDIWSEDFRERARDDRDHDFAQIYSAYQEHLHVHHLYDAEGRFWAARDVLESPSPVLGGGHNSKELGGGGLRFGLIVLDGFADFTTAQHDLLRLLSQHSDELLITLPADHADAERPARTLLFDKPRRTLELLEKSFPHLQRETASEAHFRSEGLEFVERELFREDSSHSAPTTAGLSILAANGVQGEIREIALRIKTLLATGTAHPEEIAVIYPRVDEIAPRVREVFDDFGLPFFLENFASLRTTPFYRALSKLLQLHVQDWPFDLLLDVVGNRHIKIIPADPERLDFCTAIERCIRRAQLPAGRTLLMEQLREWANSMPKTPEVQAEISPERMRLVRDAASALIVLETLERHLANLPLRSPLSQWIPATEALLTSVGLMSTENRAHWRSLRKILTAVHETDQQFDAAGKELSAEQFFALLETVAAEIVLPCEADAVGRVRVLSAESARTFSVKHLFLAGLSEQSYSSAEGNAQLYREQELHRFTGASGNIDFADQQVGEVMLLFYDAVTRASDAVTLSYPALDDKGQVLTPSPLLTELVRCCEPSTLPTTVMPAGEIIAADAVPQSQSGWRLQGVASALDGKPNWLAGLVNEPSTKQLGRAILNNIASVATRSERESFGPFEGILASDEVRAVLARRYNAEHLWSPSQLETYAACPYQFFAAQILKLAPLDELALRSDHLRRGNLLHQVLVAVHEQRAEPGSTVTNTDLIERFTSALERTIAAAPLKGLEDALREIERREISAWAAQYADQEIKYRGRWQAFDEPLEPTHFEVRFGPKARGGGANDAVSTLVPFTLDLGNEQIKLTGQIDRIDMGRINGVTVFNIIDYKSGQEVKLADKDMLAGRQLQLPLYALAAEKLLFAEQQAVALATAYWSIKAGGFASGRDGLLEFRTVGEQGLADSKRWNELSKPLVKRVGEIVRGTRRAEFPVYNENQHCTRYCEFSRICRIAQIRSLEKVWIPITQDTETPPTQPDRHAIREKSQP